MLKSSHTDLWDVNSPKKDRIFHFGQFLMHQKNYQDIFPQLNLLFAEVSPGILFEYTFFWLFGCPTANFGRLWRGQPHSPDNNHCIIQFQLEGYRKPRNVIGSLSPAEHLVGFKLGSFQFCHNATNGYKLFLISYLC